MENTKLIFTRRLILKKFEQKDKEKNLNFLEKKEFQSLDIKKSTNKEEFIKLVENAYENQKNFNLWHITKRTSQESIGLAWTEKFENGYIIKIIINDHFENRGYGCESLENIIEYLFTQVFVKEIYLKSKKENAPWQEVIKKVKFIKYNQDKDFYYYKMTNIDYMKYFAIFGEI